jgi:hypothetical protein
VIRPVDVPPGASAIWLLSDASHQRQRLVGRDGQALRLYQVMLDVITAEVAEAGAGVIKVGSIAETVAAVENFFAAQLGRGPLAATAAERRQLLREANLDIVNQVRGYYARPWAVGDPEAVVRSFICECGDRSCEAFVQVSVGDAADRPVCSRTSLVRLSELVSCARVQHGRFDHEGDYDRTSPRASFGCHRG